MICTKHWKHVILPQIIVNGEIKFEMMEFWIRKSPSVFYKFFHRIFKGKSTISDIDSSDIMYGIIKIDDIYGITDCSESKHVKVKKDNVKI